MLSPWVIEEIERMRREREAERPRPALHEELPEDRPARPPPPPHREHVIVIDLG